MSEQLADLDELVLRCRDKVARSYIKEAVRSYKTGAYRAAIVTTWIAIVFDYLDKLRELEISGHKDAKKELEEFEKHRKESIARSHMKRTFAERVRSERRVLDIVNRACQQPTLNGLSRPAIESWKMANPHASHRLTELLMLITRKIQMEVDTSKDVFDSDSKSLASVSVYLQELRQALEKVDMGNGR